MRHKEKNIHNNDSLMLIKRGKVEAQWKKSSDIFTKFVCFPTIKFAGLWLHNYGFEAGKQFEVYAAKNQLVIKVSQRPTPKRYEKKNQTDRPEKLGENIIQLKAQEK